MQSGAGRDELGRIKVRYDLARVVAGVWRDLVQTRYHTFAELREYCEQVASAVGLVCIEIFGHSNPPTRAYAGELGVALQLTNILRDIGADGRRGRIYLPLEDLARFDVAEADVLGGPARSSAPYSSLRRGEIASSTAQCARCSILPTGRACSWPTS
jgi:phytoene synthase